MWTLLLLAATVRSFAHMPLGIFDRNSSNVGVDFFSVEHDPVSGSRSNQILRFRTGSGSDWISKKLNRIRYGYPNCIDHCSKMLNQSFFGYKPDWIESLDTSTGLGSDRITPWIFWTGLGLQKSPICSTLVDLLKLLKVKETSRIQIAFTKNLVINYLQSNLLKRHWAPFSILLSTISLHVDVGQLFLTYRAPFYSMLGVISLQKRHRKIWNHICLDFDSSLQTNDSKWLDNYCDSNRASHDSTLTRKNFRWLWLEGVWPWLANNDWGTALFQV